MLAEDASPKGWMLLSEKTSLRKLQLVQIAHDREFHPDVFGLPRVDQLRHYTLHVAKLVGLMAETCDDSSVWPDFRQRRLPDLLLFGIKLSTIANERLPEVLPADEF